MSLLMEALRKAEEAKRKVQQQEAQQEDNLADANEQNTGPAPGSRSTAPTRSTQTVFTLEEREPVTSEYILTNFAADRTPAEPADITSTPVEAEDAGRASVADLQTYFSNTPQLEDAIPPQDRASARARAKQQQLAAASVFTAKRGRPKNRSTLKILLGILVLLPVIGGGIYWYRSSIPGPVGINPAIASYDLSSRGFLGETPPPVEDTAQPVAEAAPDAAELETLLTDALEIAAVDGVAGSADTAMPAEAGADPAAIEPVAAEDTSTASPPASAAVAVTPEPTPAPALASTAAEETASILGLPTARPSMSLQVTRSTASRQGNPQLLSAYARLQAGDDLAAAQLYQEVLAETPNNRDALLGLATVQSRQNNPVAARELYARLLQLNPRDPLARTGLLQTIQAIDPVEHENELKKLLSQYPEVAPLSFALGNLYAGQQRWSEAQGAYFNALLAARQSGDGAVHPDYAFNLAVSLEQLNQKGPALDYYRQARELALAITPGFDPELLAGRLAYLEQNQP